MKRTYLFLIGGAVLLYLWTKSKTAHAAPRSSDQNAGTATPYSALSDIWKRVSTPTPGVPLAQIDNTPALITASGGLLTSFTNSLKNLFGTKSPNINAPVDGPSTQPAAPIAYGTGIGSSGIDEPPLYQSADDFGLPQDYYVNQDTTEG